MSKIVTIGDLKVGGKNPVRIKGMLKTPARKQTLLVREAKSLHAAGTEAIRIAFKEDTDSVAVKRLKKEVSIPLVADIHFHPSLALKAIESGVDGIRLNPLNITKRDRIKEIVAEAREAGISIRIGVNSGGFKPARRGKSSLARRMVSKVSDYIKLFEDMRFFDIMVSLKASEVRTTVQANRLFVQRFQYPLHLGVTATGPFWQGVVKSSLGIGMLLSEGIGDIIRVSLTGPAVEEIRIAQSILQSLGLRWFYPEIISCPTCGRCQVDLQKLVEEFQHRIESSCGGGMPKKIALMGCVVNGPGEASQADIGVAFGRDKGAIFRKGEVIGVTTQNKAIDTLLKKIRHAV